jgi:hypothetical protein
VYYGDRPDPIGIGTFLRPTEIDRLFFSDTMYRLVLEGIRPWQLGPLNHALRFSDRGYVPGGHERATASAFPTDPPDHPGWVHHLIYSGELIKPDEATWFPFFRRDRWFDWSETDPILNGASWSIDHPAIWDALSVSLELANRMLLALVEDQNAL